MIKKIVSDHISLAIIAVCLLLLAMISLSFGFEIISILLMFIALVSIVIAKYKQSKEYGFWPFRKQIVKEQ